MTVLANNRNEADDPVEGIVGGSPAPTPEGRGEGQRMTRERLPTERACVTWKFSIGGHEGYARVGLYPDGRPGELFLTFNKAGSSLSGFAQAFAVAVSMLLQSGWTVDRLAEKFVGMEFDPQGPVTGLDGALKASSVVDLVFRWMRGRFGGQSERPTQRRNSVVRLHGKRFQRAAPDARREHGPPFGA